MKLLQLILLLGVLSPIIHVSFYTVAAAALSAAALSVGSLLFWSLDNPNNPNNADTSNNKH